MQSLQHLEPRHQARERADIDAEGEEDPLLRRPPGPVVRPRPGVDITQAISRFLAEHFEPRSTAYILAIEDEAGAQSTFTSASLDHQKPLIEAQWRSILARTVPSSRETGTRNGEGEDPERRLTESGAAACVPPGGRRTRPARSLASQARTAAGVPANEKGHAIAKAGPDVRGKKQRRSRSPTDTDKEPSPSQVPLRIGDLEAVTELYRSRLLRVLQLGCRSVAKAWVKALQPRKQTNYPYRGRGATRPPWWPADVPHVEPDHLSKPCRVKLLLAILRLPEACMDVLEKSTNDLPNEDVRERRPLLEEIYRVGRAEARLRAGELDPDATVYVAPSPDSLVPHLSKQKGRPASGGDKRRRVRRKVDSPKRECASLPPPVDARVEPPVESPEAPLGCELPTESLPVVTSTCCGLPEAEAPPRSDTASTVFAVPSPSPERGPFSMPPQAGALFIHRSFSSHHPPMPPSACSGPECLQRSHSFHENSLSGVDRGWSYGTAYPSHSTVMPSQHTATHAFAYSHFPLLDLAPGPSGADHHSGLALPDHLLQLTPYVEHSSFGSMRNGSLGHGLNGLSDADLGFVPFGPYGSDLVITDLGGHDQDNLYSTRVKEERLD